MIKDTRTTEAEVKPTISRAEYDAVVAENAELRRRLDFIMGQVRPLKHKTFGSSSERAIEELIGQISFIFNAAEAWKPEEKDLSESTTVAEHARKKRSNNLDSILPENIKVEVVEHGIPKEDRVCDVCGTIMERTGKEVTRRSSCTPPLLRSARVYIIHTHARDAKLRQRKRRA